MPYHYIIISEYNAHYVPFNKLHNNVATVAVDHGEDVEGALVLDVGLGLTGDVVVDGV